MRNQVMRMPGVFVAMVVAAFAGEANVHRAPANCGPTASGLKNIDAWLASSPGGEKWDVIHFNFGIHDRNTPVADYATRLERIVERLEKTGAKLVWATTTPIPDAPAQNQTARLVVENSSISLLRLMPRCFASWRRRAAVSSGIRIVSVVMVVSSVPSRTPPVS